MRRDVATRSVWISGWITALVLVHGPMSEAKASKIKDDEHIVFFDTAARFDAQSERWIVPIHGWIFEPEESTIRRKVIEEVIESKFDLEVDDASRPIFDARVHSFLVDNERGKRVQIELCGRRFVLAASQANGHFHEELQIPKAAAEECASQARLTFRAVLGEGDDRSFVGSVHLVPETGVSVISDIDDTIKITEVIDRKKMIENSFLKPFAPAPGMAELYQRWAKEGAFVHFVSSSPWHLYEALTEMTSQAGFPAATFSLKMVRVKDRTLLNLFKKGTETKPLQIEPILKAYPQRTFVLVGDSGEQDPEVYVSILGKYPDRIRKIYIRNVTGAKPTDERFSKVFEGVDPAKWALFDDPTGLSL